METYNFYDLSHLTEGCKCTNDDVRIGNNVDKCLKKIIKLAFILKFRR